MDTLQKDKQTLARHQFFDAVASSWKNELSANDSHFLQLVLNRCSTPPEIGKKTIDIGCGTGILFPFLNEWKIVALDYSQEMLDKANKLNSPNVIEYVCADAQHLPFPDNTFARAFMFGVLPHFDDPEQALREAYRVLGYGGLLTIIHLQDIETINQIHRQTGGAVADDLLPSAEGIQDLVMKAGFKTEFIKTKNRFALIGRKV
ncbi:MAG: class I SAM-dependent methyltransferase [Bacteroidetes bacterium]|nr:class I SAM-dependent methyltransferase [Bacteroidota bacterium]